MDKLDFIFFTGLMLLWLSCAPRVEAGEVSWITSEISFVSLEAQEDKAVGAVILKNLRLPGTGYNQIVISTPEGNIVVDHRTTPNGDCAVECPDTLTVVSWPEGLAVWPMSIEVAEGAIDAMRVYRAAGV